MSVLDAALRSRRDGFDGFSFGGLPCEGAFAARFGFRDGGLFGDFFCSDVAAFFFFFLRSLRFSTPTIGPVTSGCAPSNAGSSGVRMRTSPSARNSKEASSRGLIVTAENGQLPSSVPSVCIATSISEIVSSTASASVSSGALREPESIVTESPPDPSPDRGDFARLRGNAFLLSTDVHGLLSAVDGFDSSDRCWEHPSFGKHGFEGSTYQRRHSCRDLDDVRE